MARSVHERAGMRTWLLLVMVTACGSKRDFSRFIVQVESYGGVTITIAGRPVPLERRGGPGDLGAMVDFKESEVSSKTIPEVTLMTPCGPKPLALTKTMLRPPNDSNVVVLKLTRYDLPKSTRFVFAPSVKGPVTIGDIAVPTPIPRQMTVFDAGCGKPITIGSESSPIEGSHAAMIVAPSRRACLKTGVALYGSGPDCQPESSRHLSGKLVYNLPSVPSILFERIFDSTKSTSSCTNVSWIQEC